MRLIVLYVGGLLFIAVIVVLKHFGKVISKRSYIGKGVKYKSFLYHGIALAYEEQEIYSDDESVEASSIGSWELNYKGEGIFVTEKYTLFTDIKEHNTQMLVPCAVAIARNHIDCVEEIITVFGNNQYGINVALNPNIIDGHFYISLQCVVEGDPGEKDARYYISNCYDAAMQPLLDEIYTYYNKYKANLANKVDL